MNIRITNALVAGLLLFPALPTMAEEKQPPVVKKSETGGKTMSLEDALNQKITCEFSDTSLTDVFDFLRKLSGINLIVEPKVMLSAQPTSLKVTDMPLGEVLKWVCKINYAKFEIKEEAVFVDVDHGQENQPAKPREQIIPVGSKFRLKLGNGNEIEMDAAIFNSEPGMLNKLTERFLREDKADKN